MTPYTIKTNGKPRVGPQHLGNRDVVRPGQAQTWVPSKKRKLQSLKVKRKGAK